MKKIEIFDPAMCCSTGVCGPGVDPELLRMATMVSKKQARILSGIIFPKNRRLTLIMQQ